MTRRTNSTRWWSELAGPTLELLGLQKPHNSKVAPIAASLGAAGVLAGAFLMREPLGRLSRDLLTEGAALAKHVSIPELLSLAGLERRRSTLSTVTPALGAFLFGAVAGSLVAIWIGSQDEDHAAPEDPNREHANPTAYSPIVGAHSEGIT